MPLYSPFPGFATDAEAQAMALADRAITPANLRALGTPRLIASSAVALSHTGDTVLTSLLSVPIPAGILGLNGIVASVFTFSWTANANNKVVRVRFGGVGGTPYLNTTYTTGGGSSWFGRWQNRNNAALQIGAPNSHSGLGAASGGPITSAINTALAADVEVDVTLANAADTFTIERYDIYAIPIA